MRRSRWFSWARSAGRWGFMFHRLTGLALVVYLGIHLVLLSQLRHGPGQWDAFVELMSSPLVLVVDVMLFAAIALHGLNGLRLTLLGLGRAIRWQKELLWASLALAAALTAWVGARMLSG